VTEVNGAYSDLNRLAEVRQGLHARREHFASILHISASLISKWENGFEPVKPWSKGSLWQYCLLLRDMAIERDKPDLALEPHELAPHVFPAPAEVKK